ncbi:AraC family transcriptional regulator, partial [Burkholderia multivorans]
LCNMSRATFMRHFQDKLGRSATASVLIVGFFSSFAASVIRMSVSRSVAEAIGYRSVAAFRRVFTDKMGM